MSRENYCFTKDQRQHTYNNISRTSLLEYTIQGSVKGDPVVLIHGSVVADANYPLLKEPILANSSYRLISYHRRGFAGSKQIGNSKNDGDDDDNSNKNRPTISQQASDCQTPMQYLNIKSAHIVGHSHGGVIALQLAVDYPGAVHSLSLLEPALGWYTPSAKKIMQLHLPIIEKYEKGDKIGATDAFLQLVAGNGDVTNNNNQSRYLIDKVLPGAFEQAVEDIDSLFKIDMPAMQSWKVTAKDIKRRLIDKSILSVLGSNSHPMFQEAYKVVLEWFPQAEPFILPNSIHWLQLTKPNWLSRGIISFLYPTSN